MNKQNENKDRFTVKLLEHDGERFETFHIVFDEETTSEFYEEIKDISKRIEADIKDSEPYTGENSYSKLVKITPDKLDINEKLDMLIKSIENSDHESNWCDYEDGYVLTIGKYHLIYLSRAIKTLQTKSKRTFELGRNNEFAKFDNKLLQLGSPTQYDAIINKETKEVYMAKYIAENLFDIESTVIKKCETSLNKISGLEIVTNVDNLRELSLMKRNAKYYINFKESRLNYIKSQQNRNQICTKFEINIINNKIDTDDRTSANNFIKFLCNKGMIDPCDSSPVEVSNAKKWNQ